MTNLKSAIKAAVLGSSFVAASSAFALGAAVTEDFQVKLRIVPVLIITEESLMDFGDYIKGDLGAKVVSDSVLPGGRAAFNIEGQSGLNINVTVSNATTTMTTGTGTTTPEQIEVSSFTVQYNDAAIPGGGVAMTGSAVTGFTVGATATILAEDVAGQYTGTNTVSAIYL